ncbi:MAG TPA: LysM peptidoglycan-binding domain-containing protein [Firmicutes bacterium]|nr:cell wall hydrolase [Bacillota bacterium]HHT42506.1 LysM peptidoglycan-binding domain-containing protein [Bacillota bacterium]
MRIFLLIMAGLLTTFCMVNAETGSVYTVQPGDTLWDIALAHGTSWQELAALNRINDPTTLQVGARLRLPSQSGSSAKLVLHDGTTVVVTSEEQDLLARVVYAEANGEPMEGKVAVAAVIFNRVKSAKYPNSVWEVLHQEGQFTPVQEGRVPTKADASCVDAVKRALAGEDPTGGALFFYNPNTTRAADYWATKQVIKRIGNHNFAL